ncbi:hypothetical protein Gogos_005491 [Gossypium gossypioides]|uniref:Uncharacterized protein n=1 Tax=Gossypium gossypioides TaxID=34282 RepID=A0A7J9D6T6_GOSGO|nr:hypothetical protein [Gossypium gossypioides]
MTRRTTFRRAFVILFRELTEYLFVLSTKWPRIELTRSDKHSPNAEAIANNYDLLMHIFACLPIKSLSPPIPNSLVAFFSTYQASSCRNRVLQSSNLNMASSLLETCHQPMMLPLYVSCFS